MASELLLGSPTPALATFPRIKPVPRKSLPLKFIYHPSSDGIDENLLIFLHGLGDTEAPFANLGRQLRLPQTAILSLRAAERVPFLYEDAFQWYESFDELAELLAHPNPSPALAALDPLIEHLVVDCSWPADRIHLFGFAQGGTVAVEYGLHSWREKNRALGSIVSVEGPLLSYPTLKPTCATPTLFFHRSTTSTSLTALKKGYLDVKEVRVGGQGGMPRSKEEWGPIIQCWGRVLGARQPEMEGLYPVLAGGPAPPP